MLRASNPHATAEARIAERRAEVRIAGASPTHPPRPASPRPAGSAPPAFDYLAAIAERHGYRGPLAEDDGHPLSGDDLRTRTPLGRRLIAAGLRWEEAAWVIHRHEYPGGLARLAEALRQLRRDARRSTLQALRAMIDSELWGSAVEPVEQDRPRWRREAPPCP